VRAKNKSHEASYIVMEVGGTSTFVTHDVTKVEVRWVETHLKLKSHAPKERGRLTLKISSDQIWVAGYFGQPLTYPYFTIFRSDFFCNSLKS
jgi:hypothetical protein